MRRADSRFLAGLVLLAALGASGFLFSAGKTAGNFGDEYAYHLPLRELVASRLQAGELPFWNPYLFGGEPLLANPQAGVFYPGSLLFDVFPAIPALNWSLLLHVVLAWLGMQLLLRRAKLGPVGAAALAAGYALSSFLLCRVPQGVPTLLYGLAFVPWTWLLFDRPALLAASLALQFLSGHPQFMAANLAGLGAVLLVCRRDRLAAFLAGGAWSAAVVAVQLAPTLQFLSRSVRVAWSTIFKTGYSFPPIALGTLVLPNLIGNPMQGRAAVPPSVYFELFCLYMSISVLALAAVGLARGGWRRPAALMALGLFFALGEFNPLYLALSRLPVLSWVRAPGRFIVVFLWGVLLAAARGWRWASPKAPHWGWRAAALALIVGELGLWGRHLIYPQDGAAFMAPNRALVGALQDDGLHRVATSPDLANPNKLMLYHVRNATGYEAFYLESAAEYTSRSQGAASADPSRTYVRRIDTPGMEAWAVRWFMTAPQGAPRVDEDPLAKPLAYLDSGEPAGLVRDEPERRTLFFRTGTGGSMIVTEALYPGWRAWLDGRPARLEPWNGLMLSLAVPKGAGRVDLLFRPTAWTAWLALSLSAAAAWALRGRSLLEA